MNEKVGKKRPEARQVERLAGTEQEKMESKSSGGCVVQGANSLSSAMVGIKWGLQCDVNACKYMQYGIQDILPPAFPLQCC